MHKKRSPAGSARPITGVDLAQPIGDNLAEALKDALARHQVLVFPDQHLDIAAQKRLTAVFGPVIGDDYITPMEDDPFVIRVLKEADDTGGTFGGDWHSAISASCPSRRRARC